MKQIALFPFVCCFCFVYFKVIRQIALKYCISSKVFEKSARDNHKSNYGWLWVHCSAKKFERMTHTLGTRGFSRVRRELSVLAGSQHIFGRRRVTIKTWQKAETALEKSLAPRVNDTWTYLHMFASAKESNKSRFDSYSSATVVKQCIDHIPYYLSGFSAHIFSKIDLCHAAAILSQDIKKALFLHC